MTLRHRQSPDRPEEREGMRTGLGGSKDDETHPRRWPGDLGRASNTGAVLRLGSSQTGQSTDCPKREAVTSPPEGGETTLSLQPACDG